jgi:aminoglycoside N3'-acetyltransferase
MHKRVSIESLENDFKHLGLTAGSSVLVRADLSTVGLTIGLVDRKAFIQALLNTVGPGGTILSLAFTPGAPFWKIASLKPFDRNARSYAGALPNAMLRFPGSFRSDHPQCSVVAIGRHAQDLIANHGPESGAYEPVRRLIALGGKMMLVGCVESNPGFTTTHLAEVDLGLCRRVIAPWLYQSKYIDDDGTVKTFQRMDSGLCSKSYWKLYSHYVRHGILLTGFVGNAYSVLADARACYEIDRTVLARDPQYNVCESLDCVICNVLRWDRIYMWPVFVIRRAFGQHKRL